MSYCTYCRDNPDDAWNVPYHDTQYGFPLDNDDELFGRLILEINQAGLSWLTILKKADAFRRAYARFSIDAVAAFGEADRARLLADPGIIRNRLKVDAAIENAKRLQAIRASHGSFHAWLGAHHPRSKDEWTKLFKATFKFTGGEIVNEFLMSTGWLPGAHDEDCPVAARLRTIRPAASR
jgi:DNA-3-methyladenine glycosylase I